MIRFRLCFPKTPQLEPKNREVLSPDWIVCLVSISISSCKVQFSPSKYTRFFLASITIAQEKPASFNNLPKSSWKSELAAILSDSGKNILFAWIPDMKIYPLEISDLRRSLRVVIIITKSNKIIASNKRTDSWIAIFVFKPWKNTSNLLTFWDF